MYLQCYRLPLLALILTPAVLSSPTLSSPDFSQPSIATLPASSPYRPANIHFPRLKRLRDSAFGIFNGHSDRETERRQRQRGKKSTRISSSLSARYGNDVVLRFNISSIDEERALSEAADTLFLDVWAFANNWADIRLGKDDVESLLGLLPTSLGKAYSRLMPDLSDAIYHTYPATLQYESTTHDVHIGPSLAASQLPGKRDGVDNVFFKDYQPMAVIVPWMRLMSSMFSTHVRLSSIGLTHEGRDIPALRVGVHPTGNDRTRKKRQTILITGGSHAREWVSVSTVVYMAWSMITNYGKSPTITKLIEQFDWVFVPTVNVDGYVYTWETDRLWRKNRQDTNLQFCKGLDLDRSYGFGWDGTSFQSNPCSESYPGDEPFQAVESLRLAEWARNETSNNNVKFVGYLDMHSYAQQVLYPYSYTCETSPPSEENLEELALGLAKAIRLASGEYYEVQSACEGAIPYGIDPMRSSGKARARLESAGGSAIDWFYHEMRVKYSYQIKLRDTGSYGFLLPSENIVPTGEEAFNALKYFGDFLLSNKGRETLANQPDDAGAVVSDFAATEEVAVNVSLGHGKYASTEDSFPELRVK